MRKVIKMCCNVETKYNKAMKIPRKMCGLSALCAKGGVLDEQSLNFDLQI
jgi:hypothetical protein